MRRRFACVLAVAWLMTLAPDAMAQSDDVSAMRRLLVQRAQEASERSDHAGALELAEHAARIQMTPSLRLFIAEQQHALARPSAALRSALLCESEARGAPILNNRDFVMARCHELVTTLRAGVASVSVHVPAQRPDGLTVTVGGNVVDPLLYDAEYAVDPGHVVIEANAGGRALFHTEIDAIAGAATRVAVTLDAPMAAASASPAVPEVAVQHANDHAASGPARVDRRVSSPPSALHLGSIAVFGVGALTLIASAVFFGLRQESLAGCSTDGDVGLCDTPAQVQRATSDAPTWNLLTDVTLVAGGALVAIGAVGFALTMPTRGAGATSVRTRWRGVAMAMPGGVGVQIAGAF